MECKNCNIEINSKYCPECGQPTNLKRIDGKYIIHEIEHVLHFVRGILYTIRELVTNPEQNVNKYLSENRSRLVKPIIFIIITSLIYTILIHFFFIEDGLIKYQGEKSSAIGDITKWLQEHHGYSNIMIGVFIALWLKLLFWKYKYNFFEILIMLCFVMGMQMLIYSICGIIYGITHLNIMPFGGFLSIAYLTWVIGQFYDKKKNLSYLKGLFAYIYRTNFFFNFNFSYRCNYRYCKQIKFYFDFKTFIKIFQIFRTS